MYALIMPLIDENRRTVKKILTNSILSGIWIISPLQIIIYLCFRGFVIVFLPILKCINASIKNKQNVMKVIMMKITFIIFNFKKITNYIRNLIIIVRILRKCAERIALVNIINIIINFRNTAIHGG